MENLKDDPIYLVQQIREAFGDTPYPGDDHLLEDASISESEAFLKEFKGRDWREVNPGSDKGDTLHYPPESLLWMTPEAFRFYLPSYLIFCVEKVEKSDLTPYLLIRELRPPTPYDGALPLNIATARFRRRIKVFNPKQIGVLRQFFRFILKSIPEIMEEPGFAIDSLKDYWKI